MRNEISGAPLVSLPVHFIFHTFTMAKIKAHELRSQDKTELLKTLEELKNELSQVCLLYTSDAADE